MKLTKGEFKLMIKECIKELIKEGAFNQALKESFAGMKITSPTANRPAHAAVAKPNPVDQGRARSMARRMAGYDDEFANVGAGTTFSMDNEGGTVQPLNPNMLNLVENTARAMAKGDPKAQDAYAAIFADTAANTLPQMLLNDPNRSGYGSLAAAGMNAAQEKVAPEQLEQLAGPQGDVSRWATIAFGKHPAGDK